LSGSARSFARLGEAEADEAVAGGRRVLRTAGEHLGEDTHLVAVGVLEAFREA
jgi:hypothetical protein